MELEKAKSELRRRIFDGMKVLTDARRISESERACALLVQQSVWKSAERIAFFAPLAAELDLWPLFLAEVTAGRAVGLPRFDPLTKQYGVCRVQNLETEIRPGQFGIREPAPHCEPIPLNRLDLILVPGVAFDLRGRRLGRGKGFYDRLLAGASGTKCGVAFDEQIVGEVPSGPHDIRLNCILTPTRFIET